jgi:hypothetical protein
VIWHARKLAEDLVTDGNVRCKHTFWTLHSSTALTGLRGDDVGENCVQ